MPQPQLKEDNLRKKIAPATNPGLDQPGQEGQTPNPEQVNYDIFVSQGIKAASNVGPKMKDKASIDGLGNVLFDIVNKIQTEGSKNGIEFSLGVILHGSNEILAQLIAFSGVEIDEKGKAAAIGIAVGRWIEDQIQSGKMTMEQAQQLAQQAQGIIPQQEGGQPGQPGQAPETGAIPTGAGAGQRVPPRAGGGIV